MLIHFQDILSQNDDPHPVVILPDTSAEDVSGILEFLYYGELNVKARRISAVLKVAESLQISSLIEVSKILASSFGNPILHYSYLY